MGFLDELTAPDPARSRCSIAAIRAQLGQEEAGALTVALAGPIASSTLAKRLTGLGYPISSSSVLRHRKGHCRCSDLASNDAGTK